MKQLNKRLNIILFGPPGIGKSTLIGALKLRGQKAIDLEDIYPNALRYQVPSIVEGCYIGGADLNPQRKYNNCKKVLLYMDQESYSKRRAERDRYFKEKGLQARHDIDNWVKAGGFNYIVDVANKTPDQVVDELIKLISQHN